MSGLLARHATAADLDEVLRLIHESAAWLHARGIDQWPHDSPTLGADAIGAYIAAGRTVIVEPVDGGPAVATVAVSPEADPDFWDTGEQMVPAWYISKLAVTRTRAGRDLGGLLLRWVGDRAHAAGVGVLRLDVWKTNAALQGWYRRQGWAYLRTVDHQWRNSGALFEKASGEDVHARLVFAGRSEWMRQFMRGERVLDTGPCSGHTLGGC